MVDFNVQATDVEEEMYPERHGTFKDLRKTEEEIKSFLPTDEEVTLLIDLISTGPVSFEHIADKESLQKLVKRNYAACVVINRQDDYYAVTRIGAAFFSGLQGCFTFSEAIQKMPFNYPKKKVT